MPRNGTGTYSLPAGNPVANGSVASSANFNSTLSDIATALTNSVAKDGQTVPAADLPMGGQKHTGVGNATARTHYATAGQVQDGAFLVLGSVSGTNTITAAATPAVTALVTGQAFRFKAAGENTGGVTLAVDGLSAVSVKKFGTLALTTGDIASAGYVQVVYDGSEFQLLNPTVAANLPELATQSEMETGTETGLRSMSPLRVAQAIAAKALASATQAEMEAGTESALRAMSPLRVAQAIAAAPSVNTGTILPFGGATLPTGYLECDGANVSRSTYAGLFAAVSTTWGAGDGSTTFGLPDLRRRTLIGAGGTSASGPANTLGSTGGSETHTLTTSEMPAHTHSNGNSGSLALGSGFGSAGFGNTGSTGGGGAHNNMQPSAVVKYMIKT